MNGGSGLVHGPEEDLLVDIGLDSAPGRPATLGVVGPTFAIEELAGRTVVALFDRAAARDFADVYMLAQRFPKDTLLALALEVDAGFDRAVFAEMIAHIDRYRDLELDLDGVRASEVRAFSETGSQTFARTPSDRDREPACQRNVNNHDAAPSGTRCHGTA